MMLARQVGHELTALRRTPITMILSVGFPLLFFVLLSSMLGNEVLDTRGGIRVAQFLAPGMASFGVVMATFSFLAVGFAEARASGALRRQQATPVPAWVQIGGRVGAAMVLGLVATALVLGIGALAYDVQLFARTAAAVVVALVLGSLTFSALGLALAAVLPGPQATIALTNGIVVPLSFVSDVFMSGGDMPVWMERLGWAFPLKHLAVLLGDALNPYLTGSGFSWDHIGALAAWGVGGAVVAAWAMRREQTRSARVRGAARAADARPARTVPPSAFALVVAQVGHTQRVIWRDASSVFFAVVFPALLVIVIPAVNGGGRAVMDDGRLLGEMFAVTMAVYGAAVTAYVTMPVDVVEGRERGVLERVHGTPLPAWAFLAGRVTGALVVGVLTLLGIAAIAAAAYGVGLPARWPVALGVFVLSVVCFAMVGLAVALLAPTGQAATGLTLGTLLPLCFISDVFVMGVTFPPVLDTIAGVAPLRPAVRSMLAATAAGGAGPEPGNLLILAAWALAGTAVVAWRFRWTRTRAAGRSVSAAGVRRRTRGAAPA